MPHFSRHAKDVHRGLPQYSKTYQKRAKTNKLTGSSCRVFTPISACACLRRSVSAAVGGRETGPLVDEYLGRSAKESTALMKFYFWSYEECCGLCRDEGESTTIDNIELLGQSAWIGWRNRLQRRDAPSAGKSYGLFI
jgi:hypothetical protein